MAVLPAVEDFPTFADTVSWLKVGAKKCIWYLPDRKRCCIVTNHNSASDTILHGAKSIVKGDLETDRTLKLLMDIAEQSCCARHHRNKIWGSGLGQQLAVRWQNELRWTLSPQREEMSQGSKLIKVQLKVSASSMGTIEVKDEPIDEMFGTQRNPADQLGKNHLSAGECGSISHSSVLAQPVAFAKHEVHVGETLVSKLLSPIATQAGKIGSLYIYTHEEDAFRKRLKIGYTRGKIEDRLDYWAECGHGSPILLKSFDSVRHPERVELLTHFELVEYWYAQRWCKIHRKSHIEWCKIDLLAASSAVHLWGEWMERANPYDRRGQLKPFWREAVEFLSYYQVTPTGEVLMQIQELEEGSAKVFEFLDDNVLRKRQPTSQCVLSVRGDRTDKVDNHERCLS